MANSQLLDKLLAAKKNLDALHGKNPEAFSKMKEDYDNLMHMIGNMGGDTGAYQTSSEAKKEMVEETTPSDVVVQPDVKSPDEIMKAMMAAVKTGQTSGTSVDTAMGKMKALPKDKHKQMMDMVMQKMKDKKKGGHITPDMAGLYGM